MITIDEVFQAIFNAKMESARQEQRANQAEARVKELEPTAARVPVLEASLQETVAKLADAEQKLRLIDAEEPKA